MTPVGDTGRDESRRAIAAGGLTPAAVAHLTRDALGRIDLDHLAPVKGLLKQFFSDARWTAEDDDALADLVGPGEGWWHHVLAGEFDFAFGWQQDRFRLELTRTDAASPAPEDGGARDEPLILNDAFAGAITPEATPNPRTIRFVIGDIHTGPSRWYESGAHVDDPRVARLFREFDDVANVLIGPDFVAIGVRRADRWEQLLGPMLRVLEAEFPTEPTNARTPNVSGDVPEARMVDVRGTAAPVPARAFDRAWAELRALHLSDRDDVARLLAAASSSDVATRQVAARVLLDAAPEVAFTAWSDLLADRSRVVRRATVDAMADADRPVLRPLFERALADGDAWTRWKALRALVEIGIEPSRDAVRPLVTDVDFRVRLEAARALRT